MKLIFDVLFYSGGLISGDKGSENVAESTSDARPPPAPPADESAKKTGAADSSDAAAAVIPSENRSTPPSTDKTKGKIHLSVLPSCHSFTPFVLFSF
jgi:hypothetical protein